MVTALFFVLYALFTLLFIFLFDAFSLAPVSIILWFVALLPGFIASVLTMALIVSVYGRIHVKRADAFDMRHHDFANSLMRGILRVGRLKITVTGKENIPEEPFILASNHQTLFDILAMKTILSDRPLVFIAKHELFRMPVIGKMIRLLGNVPIQRERDRAAAQAIIEGIKMYKKGATVMVFPEGHRSRKNEMIPFKAGSFKLAMKPGAPLVVACVYDMHKAWKGWPFIPQKARIHFHPPISPDFYEGKTSQEVSTAVRETIRKKLDEFRSQSK